MAYPIGHIFTNGTVIRKDVHGRWLIKIQGPDVKTGILKLQYIPSKMNVNRHDKLNNLIVLGRKPKKVYDVAIDNYMSVLIKHYYKSFSSTQIKIDKWKRWYHKWGADCNSNFNHRTFKVEGPVTFKVQPRTNNFYKLIKDKEYVLPVVGYKDLIHLNAPTLFYPGTTYDRNTDKEVVGDDLSVLDAARTVYKIDGNNPQLPIKYEATIIGKDQNDQSVKKNVILFLHGFTSPAKWHRNVWKHMHNNKSKGVFKHCQVSHNNNTCNEYYCINKNINNKELFSIIHQSIKEDCNEHLKQIVTMFEKNTTKLSRIINIYDRVRYNSKYIKINCVEDVTSGYYNNLIIYGVCHNWPDVKPVFHFNLITKYESKSRSVINDRERIIFSGKLENIRER